jgi:MFS family permease
VGLALLAYGVVAVIAQGVLVRRFALSPLTLLRVGLPIAIAGYLLFAFSRAYAPLTVALCLQGLGQGLMLPGITAACSLAVTDDEQGAVAGLSSSAQGLGRALGPLIGPLLYQEVAGEAPYLFSAGTLVLVLAVVIVRPSVARDEASLTPA